MQIFIQSCCVDLLFMWSAPLPFTLPPVYYILRLPQLLIFICFIYPLKFLINLTYKIGKLYQNLQLHILNQFVILYLKFYPNLLSHINSICRDCIPLRYLYRLYRLLPIFAFAFTYYFIIYKQAMNTIFSNVQILNHTSIEGVRLKSML